MTAGKKIVLLCSACYPTTVLFNYINSRFPIERVIEEKSMRGLSLAKRRFRKLGFLRASGQVAFSFLVVPFLKWSAQKRIEAIKKEFSFDDTAIPAEKIQRVETVNDEACIRLLQQVQPDIILVSGTRIISKKVLASCPAPFINMHAGITPQYRGVHGGYWAVAHNDPEHFGVTIHRVDTGIDTGEVLYQQTIGYSEKDNYCSYPFLQLGAGLPLMKKAVEDICENRPAKTVSRSNPGKLWYHPTIWQYFFYRPKNKRGNA